MNVLTIIVSCKVIINVYDWNEKKKEWWTTPREIEIEGEPEHVNKWLEHYDRNLKIADSRVVHCKGELFSI